MLFCLVQSCAYLENQATIIHFDVRKLLIEIEPNLLTKLSLSQVTTLIDYLYDTSSLQLVDKNNYQKLLKDAELYSIQKELDHLKEELSERSQAVQDYSDILELGQL